jgi:hypothetical protein
LLATELAPLPGHCQLPIPSGVNLLLASGKHVRGRDIADGTGFVPTIEKREETAFAINSFSCMITQWENIRQEQETIFPIGLRTFPAA